MKLMSIGTKRRREPLLLAALLPLVPFYATTLALLLLSSALVAQDASAASGSRRFSLLLPKDVRSETVQIRYFTTGPSGGYSGFIRQQPGLRSYELAASATNVKVIVYIAGCQIDTLDLSAGMPTTQPLQCNPLESLQLAAQIIPSDVLAGKNTVVEVTYLAFWAHEFFGIMDGLVTTFPVATVTPDDTGAFRVSLPDFARDAVSTRWKQKGEWQFLLREVGTGNIVAWLNSDESQRNPSSLPVPSSYPDVVKFTAVAN